MPQLSIPALSRAQLEVAGVVSFYMAAALVMVFVNKAVLLSTPGLPLLFLLVQLLVAVALLHLAERAAPRRVALPRSIDAAKLGKLAPVVLVNGIGLVFNTLCLRGVEAAFFQIARGLVLPLTIAVSALHTRDTPNARVLGAAGVVTAGFLLGVSRAAPDALALLYGFLSSLFIAVHAVLIKTSLPAANNSALELAYWSNAGGVLILLPCVLLTGEHATLATLLRDAERWNWGVFVSGCAITGVFGFLLCVAGLLSVKVTSPVTHMFSSAARSALQTLLGVWLFNDVLTVNRAGSIALITAGTLYYTWVKSTGGGKPPAPEPARREAMDIEAKGGLSEAEEEDALMKELRLSGERLRLSGESERSNEKR